MKNQLKNIVKLASLGVVMLLLAGAAYAGPGVGDQTITITNVSFAGASTNILSSCGTNGIFALPFTNGVAVGAISMPSTSLPFNAETMMEVVGTYVGTNANPGLQVVLSPEDDLNNFGTDPLTTNTFFLAHQGTTPAGYNLTNYFSGWFQLPRASFGQAAGLGIYSVGVTGGAGGFITNTSYRVLSKNLYFPN